MSEWKTCKLEDIAHLKGGFAFKSADYSDNGIFVLRTLNISDKGYITKENAVFIPVDKFHLYERFLLEEQDTLFVMVGATLGKIGYVTSDVLPALLNQNMWLIRSKDGKCNKRYLNYAFQYFVLQNLSWTSGSAREFARRDDYRNMQIHLPPLKEQQAIAYVLGSLDDKIELNRRMNETLEAMARALFKEWFVDFGPVRAKMDGREPEGLAPEIAALFPDTLDEEGTPTGWSIQTLSSLINIVGGGTPKTSIAEYWNGDIPWFSVVDAPTSTDMFVIQTQKTITELGLKNSSARLLPEGTTIISARGTVGKLALVGEPMAMNQSCYAIYGKHTGAAFTYFLIKSVIQGLQSNTHGSVFDTITRSTFDAVHVTPPPLSLSAYFETTVAPLMDKILSNLRESTTLAQLRDLLLPKLMSGEIRVRDAERLVAETL